jgi:methylenetetrahydrofolate reductase (NADPH)
MQYASCVVRGHFSVILFLHEQPGINRKEKKKMKAIDVWNASDKPTISFELFPARSDKAAVSLEKTIDTLAALEPDFVSVTFGAGGSTREGSRQLIQKLKHEKGLDIIAYFACYGLGPDDIVSVLDSYQEIGVENVLAVRGDEPREEGFEPHPNSLEHASDLVTFIRPRYDFCLGVAGYPEGHIDAPSKEKDLEFLKLKVDQGAEYIITNYCYDNEYFFDYVNRCRATGIEVPILPGVMPIYSVKMMEMLAGLCGATITDEIRQGIASLPEDDKEALLNFGIEFAYRQCVSLLESGVPGLHFYTMDRSASTVGVVERLRKDGLL